MAIMDTQTRLSYIRWMLRWGVTLRVEYLRDEECLSTTYNRYSKDDYNEWLYCVKYLGGGCNSCSNENIIDASKTFLRLIRDNHIVKIEDLYNSIVLIPEKDRNKEVISIQWGKEQLQLPFVGTIFGKFTALQSASINDCFEKEQLEYNQRIMALKLVISDNLGINRDQCRDSDVDIDADTDMSLECNQDLVKPKYASDYLKKGEYPPPDAKFDQRAVETSIRSNSIELIKWALAQCDSSTLNRFGQNYIKIACEQGVIDIVKYLISELKITLDGTALRNAVYSENQELVDYLLSMNVPTNRLFDWLAYKETTTNTWNLIKYIHSIHPVYFDDTVLRNVCSNKEQSEWILLAGASRIYAVYDAACDGNLDDMKTLLTTDSINYETSEKRQGLLLEAFKGMLRCKDNSFKLIYEVLIEHGIFEKLEITKVINLIHNSESCISIFEYGETILGFKRWKLLLTPELAFKVYQISPIKYFDKLVKIDLLTTFRIIAHRKIGIDKIVDYCSTKYGDDWPNKIDPNIRDCVIQSSQDPQYAISKGFKLYQSIYQKIGYRNAVELFSVCPEMIKDDEAGWKQQENIFKEHTFVDTHCNELKDDQQYRVIVFDWGNEIKGEDGYWREVALYDVQNSIVIEETPRNIKMEGINNGPLKQVNAREGEPNWNNETKTFFVVKENKRWSFHTGRDGGSLNCGGGYYVRIIK